MSTSVDEQLARLPALSTPELQTLWGRLTGGPVPRVSAKMLRLALAWEIQAKAYGGLKRETVRLLDQLERGQTRTVPPSPGMRLIREWQGRAHIVLVGEDKVVRYEGREYGSLSEVARAITGTRWSGPAFFGLAEDRGMKPVRCAIYTRKSSEEGLEQDFNSLDAQREACAAYVLSQAGEGWTALATHYDDGGISGGTLERPALQRLLADVDAGRIDIIVVYKVDRLSRSLFDFAKLVERFEAAGTSFVSVTQSFNTTTSMGRLTLNMLLSFAQFEREVTAERIRDKLAASKAKGMWMGGVPPLGYKPDGRTLAVVEEHAALVRHIYERYAALRSVRALGDELQQQGTLMPKRVTITGKPTGGGPFSRGQLYALLTRRLYLGEITHKGVSHPGLHQPIIAHDMFERVQQIIANNNQGDHRRSRASPPHLLAGRVFDASGEPLTATHATKGTARYRYYVSRRLNQGRSTDGMRVPARELETVVVERIAAALDDPIDLISRCALNLVPAQLTMLQAAAAELAARVRGRDPGVIADLVVRVTVYPDRVSIACAVSCIAGHLGFASTSGDSVELNTDVALKRSGIAVRLVQPDGSLTSAGTNPSLVRLLVRARRWWAELKKGEIDATRLAEREGVTRSYLLRVTKLAFLSPALTDQILRGQQGARITPAALVAPYAVAHDWKIQAV